MKGAEIARILNTSRQSISNSLKRAMGKCLFRVMHDTGSSPFTAASILAEKLQVDDEDYVNFYNLFPVSFKYRGKKYNVRKMIEDSSIDLMKGIEREIDIKKYEARNDNKTKRKSYHLSSEIMWITSALEYFNGKAKAKDIYNYILKNFKNEFNAGDMEKIKSGELRWKKKISWARYEMVKRGLLKKDSTRGFWELV